MCKACKKTAYHHVLFVTMYLGFNGGGGNYSLNRCEGIKRIFGVRGYPDVIEAKLSKVENMERNIWQIILL